MLVLGGERSRNVNAAISIAATFALASIAVILFLAVDNSTAGILAVYRLGNWPAPFAIVLVADRLAALYGATDQPDCYCCRHILLVAGTAREYIFIRFFSFCSWVSMAPFSLAISLISLFLRAAPAAAPYGLALHGSGSARVKASLHYIVINLVASLLFLIGVSLIYGVSGTLNMAHLANLMPRIHGQDRALFEAGASILGLAFLVKAGTWPLCFWLPNTYASATPPVACIFAILSKVGAYAVLRLWLLLFGTHTTTTQFGSYWLFAAGIATVTYGVLGSLVSVNLARFSAFSLLVSSGTVLAAISIGQVSMTGAALFYLASSTLAISASFLLAAVVDGDEVAGDARDEGPDEFIQIAEEQEVGIPISKTVGTLGLAFMACALLIAGLPPLSGFLAKLSLLSAAFQMSSPIEHSVPVASWIFLTMLVLSGLIAVIVLAQTGIRLFWASSDRTIPRVQLVETAPIIALLFLCVVQTIAAGPLMRFMQATAKSLHSPEEYVRKVLDLNTVGTKSPSRSQ